MSRSFKKAIITLSKRFTDNIHRRIRSRVKTKLNRIDFKNPDDIDLIDIETDMKDIGGEWGTKLGWEYEDIMALADDEDEQKKFEQDRDKERRK